MNFFSPAVDLDRSSRSSLNASTLLYLEKVSKIMLALMLALIICLAAQLGRYDEIAARNSQMLKELENLKLMVEKNQQRIINQVFFSFKVLQQVYFFQIGEVCNHQTAPLPDIGQILEEKLWQFDADRTGMADFALESAGAEIIPGLGLTISLYRQTIG